METQQRNRRRAGTARRWVATLAAGFVVASGVTLIGAVPASAEPVVDDEAAFSSDDLAGAAQFLIGNLVGDPGFETHFASDFGADVGLTADGILALLAAGSTDDALDRMVGWLEFQVDAYGDPAGAAGGPYAGSLAKLALVAEATGKDPHDFGGADLLGILAGNVCEEAIPGDFSPCPTALDFQNTYSTLGHTLAVVALQGSPKAADHLTVDSPAVVRLHQLQCEDGGFTSKLLVDGDECVSDVDSTAFAVQALATVAGTDAWLGAAQKYLLGVQKDSGLFPGAAGDNSNSTGLAAQALQTLVNAAETVEDDVEGDPLDAPTDAWSDALNGLASLLVEGSGFAVTADSLAPGLRAPGAAFVNYLVGGAPDVRATTQALLAAAQKTLPGLIGAELRSQPRELLPETTTSSPSSTIATSTSTTSSSSSAPVVAPTTDDADQLPETGTDVTVPAVLAVALLLAGASALLLARRRAASGTPSHRA